MCVVPLSHPGIEALQLGLEQRMLLVEQRAGLRPLAPARDETDLCVSKVSKRISSDESSSHGVVDAA